MRKFNDKIIDFFSFRYVLEKSFNKFYLKVSCGLSYLSLLNHFYKLVRLFKFLENVAFFFTTGIPSSQLLTLSAVEANFSLLKTSLYNNNLSSSLFYFFFVSSVFTLLHTNNRKLSFLKFVLAFLFTYLSIITYGVMWNQTEI